MFDVANVNWALYEDGSEYKGMASATLPTASMLTQTLSGAGIAGEVNSPIIGHTSAMSMTLNFKTTTKQNVSLSAPRRHNIELRAAVQDEDPVNGVIAIRAVKHILAVEPTSHSEGNVGPATSNDGSGEYAVFYWATYIDGEKVREIDPLNFIHVIGGVDYLADVRKALGKE